jgi:hypothetical protein
MAPREVDGPSDATPPEGTEAPEDMAAELERLRQERDELNERLEDQEGKLQRRKRFRHVGVGALVVIACLLLTLTAPAVWTYRTLLTTDVFLDRVTPIGFDPAVTPVLSDRLTNQVFALIDVEEVVADALPERGQILAGPLTGAIRDFVEEKVNEVLASDGFETAWTGANRFAHEQIVAILRDEGDIVSTAGGVVTLNLLPIVNEALQQIESQASGLFQRDVSLPEVTNAQIPEEARARISSALGVTVPSDFGEIEVFNSDGLETAQNAVRFFDRTIIFLIVASVLTFAAALWFSTNRRRTLLQLVVGTLVGLVLVRRVFRWFDDQIVDLAQRPDGRRALNAITDQVLGSYFSVTSTIILVGIAIIVLALVTGPYPWAVKLRTRIGSLSHSVLEARPTSAQQEAAVAWTRGHIEILQLGGALFGILLLLLWDFSWIAFLLLAAVLVLYQLALLRIRAQGGGGS